MTPKNGSLINQLELQSGLAILQTIIDESRKKNRELIIIGDFNLDLARESTHTDILEELLDSNEWHSNDRNESQTVNYTFRSANSFTWLDHVISSVHNKNTIEAKIILKIENLSDHLPVVIKCSLEEK